MDDFSFAFGLVIAIFSSLLTGIISYGNAKSAMQEQAIAAQVACYKVDSQGQRSFVWNCKQ